MQQFSAKLKETLERYRKDPTDVEAWKEAKVQQSELNDYSKDPQQSLSLVGILTRKYHRKNKIQELMMNDYKNSLCLNHLQRYEDDCNHRIEVDYRTFETSIIKLQSSLKKENQNEFQTKSRNTVIFQNPFSKS